MPIFIKFLIEKLPLNINRMPFNLKLKNLSILKDLPDTKNHDISILKD